MTDIEFLHRVSQKVVKVIVHRALEVRTGQWQFR
jgi:hypothetical protein